MSSSTKSVCATPVRESISGTVRACGETPNASANTSVSSGLGVRIPSSYCAIRVSADFSGNPTFVPSLLRVKPRSFRKKLMRSLIDIFVSPIKTNSLTLPRKKNTPHKPHNILFAEARGVPVSGIIYGQIEKSKGKYRYPLRPFTFIRKLMASYIAPHAGARVEIG